MTTQVKPITDGKKEAVRPVFLLALIIALGLALRLYGLDQKGIWYDEACSIAMAQAPLGGGFFQVAGYKPLYFLFLQSWMGVPGGDVLWLRLPSVIFAVLSLVAIYRIGAEIAGRQAGLSAAFLLSISVFNIYHSQQIRHFTFLALLALLSQLFFIKLLKTGKPRHFALNAVLNSALIFVHPYAFWIPAVQLFYFCFCGTGERPLRPRWLLWQLVPFVCFVVWLLLSDVSIMRHNVWWIPRPGWKALLETLETFSYGGGRYGLDDFTAPFRFPEVLKTLFAGSVFFFLAGVFLKPKEDAVDPGRFQKLLLIWFFLPVAASFFVSFFIPVFSIKHFAYVAPAFYLLISLGLCRMGRKWLTAAVLALFFALNAYPLAVLYGNDLNIHWKDAGSYVRASGRAGDAVLISTSSEIAPFLYYFSAEHGKSLGDFDPNRYGRRTGGGVTDVFYQDGSLIVGIKQDQGEGFAVVRDDLEKKVAFLKGSPGFGNVWFVVSRWTAPGYREFMLGFLRDAFNFKDSKDFSGVSVYRFAKDGRRP